MSEGAWVLVAALGLATAFGLWRAARDGRFRGTHLVHGAADPADPGGPTATDGDPARADLTTDPATTPDPSLLGDIEALGHHLGERATLLQFSSAFCAPCRATRRILAEVATVVPGVAHVEIDAEHHLDLVRRVHVLRTPTTLVLDASGREVTRAAGTPRRDEVLATLARVVAP